MKVIKLGLIILCFLILPAQAKSVLDSNWKLARLSAEENNLTVLGKEKMAAYSYMKDDPALLCSPTSFTRIVFTPQTYLQIRTFNDHVEIDYEFMDVKRSVPIDPLLTTKTAPYSVPDHPHLGRSVARIEDSTLIIETAGYEAGLVTTLTSRAGLPRSADMWTEERFIVNGDKMTIKLTHIDPIYYAKPLIMNVGYDRTEEELLEFGCELEEADPYN